MGRVLYVLAIGIAVGGCAQIFGFDDTRPLPDDGIQMTWQRTRIGDTLVVEPIDLSAGSATFLVVDPTEPTGFREYPATLAGNETWFGDVPTGTPASVVFHLPDDTITRVWQYPSRTLRGLYNVLGDPAAEPAPPNAQLDLSVTLDVPYAGEQMWIYTVGSWSYRIFGGAELPVAGATAFDPPAVPYASAASLTGRPLERIRTIDPVTVLRYVGSTLSGTLAVTPFDQQDGVDTITGTMTTVTQDQTLAAQFSTTVAGPRYTATTPGVAGLAMSWSVNASPGLMTGNNSGPQLLAGGLTEADTGTISLPYGNPFAWPTTDSFSTSETRTYMPVGATAPTTLYAGMYSIATPGAGQVFDLPQGLPLLVTLAGTALTIDGMTVAFDRTKAVQISFVVDRQACDLYQLTVYELVDQAGTRVYTPRAGISSLTPQFTVPGDLFTAGSMYTLRAVCQLGGLPGLADGDLVPRTFPTHVGYLDSGVFTVGP